MNKGIVSLVAIATVITGTFFTSTSAYAESLKETLTATYHSNPDLLRQRSILRGVDEGVSQANSGFLPSLEATASYGRSWVDNEGVPSQPAPETIKQNNLRYGATLTQPIFNGFRDVATRKQAKSLVMAGRAQLQQVEQNVFVTAVTAYLDVLRDDAVLGLQENNVQVLERQLQASQDRFRVGEITRTDVAQSQARLANAKTQRLQAEASMAGSRAFFARVVGRQATTLDSKNDLPVLPSSLDDAIGSARDNSPALKAARYNEQAARHAVKRSSSSLLPSLAGQASISTSEVSSSGNDFLNPGRTTKSVGVQLTVPLYSGGANHSRTRQAKQLRSQRMVEIEKADREVVEEVTKAWDQFRAAQASIISTKSQVDANEIALEGVRQEASVGSRTTLDVLNAEQEMLNSRVNMVRAERDEMLAAYNLLAAAGQLTAQHLALDTDLYNPEDHYDDTKMKLFGTGIN